MSAAKHPEALRPRDAADVVDLLRARDGAVEVIGGGSKRSIGVPVAAEPLDMSSLSGIVAYEPAELVLTAHAATPLAIIERELAAHGQRLAFEPPHFGALFEDEGTDRRTLGGVLAANVSGSRRIAAGAARDHFLGFHAVTGDGVPFKAGGRVVKNVTGYDLPKLVAGSWGTLVVLTEVTVRVAPLPETETTVILRAATPRDAVETLTRALASPHDVSAAAFVPGRGCALRIEGFGASVAERAAALLTALEAEETVRLVDDDSRAFWARIGGAEALADCELVFRISVPPSDAPRIIAALEPERYLLDWGGGLIWAAFSEPDMSRIASVVMQGHATLWKAPRPIRETMPIYSPVPPGVASLAARVKQALDPHGRLNPGRFGSTSSGGAGTQQSAAPTPAKRNC